MSPTASDWLFPSLDYEVTVKNPEPPFFAPIQDFVAGVDLDIFSDAGSSNEYMLEL